MAKIKTTKLLALLFMLPLLGLGCKGGGSATSKESLEPVTLKYWQVFNEPSDFTDTIAAFKRTYPHINVTVRKLRLDEYEDAIVRALAEGNGPDIISVQTAWLKHYQNLLAVMPASVTLPATVVDGNKTAVALSTVKLPSSQDLRTAFVDTVAPDVTLNTQIYGLPLSVDTLGLYYNRQLLNQAGVTSPPRTWEEFKNAVKLLTTQDRNGNIVQAGAALGGSRNINRAPDILAVLMMQNGTEMAKNGKAAFNQIPANLKDASVVPGRDALRFYTDFASPAKEVYTWNENLPESLDAFANQQAAFFFGYSYHLPLIRSLAPGIDLGITKLPQIAAGGKQVNFANYWLEGVTKQSAHPSEAWGFIQFATSEPGAGTFLQKSGKPTALRALISSQRGNEMLAPFADQLLTAQTWYHGADAAAMEEAMRAAIEQVASGGKEPDAAIDEAVRNINLTY
ncbi:MAG: extracellular solute-binding protein [Parcubacteria group bacterium]|nr:extracellular solute-binding protein [Parcubacteria group bacterium]